MNIIELDGIEIPYVVDYRNVKYMRLEIKPDGSLLVVMPKKSTAKPLDFIMEKKSWILRKIREIRRYQELASNGKESKLLLFGNYYDVQITRGRYQVILENTKVTVSVPNGRNPYIYLKNWVKEELRMRLKKHLERHVPLLNVDFSRFFIKTHKSKWGSCSAKKNLNFNIKLAALPDELIEYVVIHELTHLLERKHNRIFWMRISKFCPDYKGKEKELAKYWFAIHSNKVWLKLLER
jgi:hypothetical protein